MANESSDNVSILLNTTGENRPPEASDDAYEVAEDQTLTVPATEGVLDNDQDPDEGDTLTAELVVDVKNGALTLNPDGSFSYTPKPRFDGQGFEDSFTYKASDGQAMSNTVTVTISVQSACTVTGAEGTDVLAGTSGDDVICGLGANDVIYDLAGGNDTFVGGAGVDILYSLGGGEDTLFGGEGDDFLIEFDQVSANDALDGEGSANDFCYADRGDTRNNCERGN